MSKWDRRRGALIEMGVDLARRGYAPSAVAASMVQQHFKGLDRKAAARRLARSIGERFWLRYAGRTEAQQAIHEMATALTAEGWTPLFAEDSERCFWQHTSGASVNCNGGFFHCYAAATKRAYESATRTMLVAR